MSIISDEELAQIGKLRRYREKLAEAAALFDRLAERLDNLSDIFARKIGNREPTMPKHAADCRAMAKKLRGET